MLASLIAERYAKALLTAAKNEKALETVGPQAQSLADALAAAQGVSAFLTDPLAGAPAKLAVLTAAFGDAPHPLMKAFLQTVLEHKRERYLPGILHTFSALVDEAEGRMLAPVGTAKPLPASTRKLLEGALSSRLGRKVTLEPYTDKNLLGGAVLRLGDTVFDGSLRSSLQRLGAEMRRGPLPQAKAPAAKKTAKKKAAPAAKKKAAAKKTAPKQAKKTKKTPKKLAPKKSAKK
jgi:F-type H+-transporting ATPase subunit delta